MVKIHAEERGNRPGLHRTVWAHPGSPWRRDFTVDFCKGEWESGGVSFGLGTFRRSWGSWLPELSPLRRATLCTFLRSENQDVNYSPEVLTVKTVCKIPMMKEMLKRFQGEQGWSSLEIFKIRE